MYKILSIIKHKRDLFLILDYKLVIYIKMFLYRMCDIPQNEQNMGKTWENEKIIKYKLLKFILKKGGCINHSSLPANIP